MINATLVVCAPGCCDDSFVIRFSVTMKLYLSGVSNDHFFKTILRFSADLYCKNVFFKKTFTCAPFQGNMLFNQDTVEKRSAHSFQIECAPFQERIVMHPGHNFIFPSPSSMED